MTETLVDLLGARAADAAYTPYTLLADGDDDVRTVTAAALDAHARRIAGALASITRPGDRALILTAPGLEYIAAFFGCLYAGVIAVPAYPPDPRRLARTLPRLQAIVETAGARVTLTTRDLHDVVASLVPLPTISIDDAQGDHRAAIDRDSIAMLQFTSGSTAAPRGVILTHGCILANLAAMSDAFELAPDLRIVSWLPPYHDMGLIGGILAPLYCGASQISMSPLHFLQRPARWLRAITKYKAHISGGPNFAFDLCVRKVDLDREALDLSSWEVAFDGAEVVRPSTLAAFAAKFEPVGFRKRALFPCYGLAEATLLATSVARGAGATTRELAGAARVSCGRAARGVEVSIVDGEIALAGPSISPGYWGHEPFAVPLRTGDLGMIVDGELYVTGRRKDLIIFSGRKLFPDDVEQVAASAHPSLRPTVAAFGVDLGGEQLVLVQEVDQVDAAARTAITRAIVESFDLAPHAIELVPAGTIPKTSSGKVQRHACKEAWLRGEMRGE